MKKIFYIICLISLINCNSEDAGDCVQTAGEIIQQEIEVSAFSKILVLKKVELILTEGPIQKVVIETGENLMSDIEVKVIDNEIVLENHNNCNFFRNYGITKVYITSPNITEIRNASELNVSSNGVLTYPSLYLRSTGEKSDFLGVGDWHLTIENEKVIIWSNGISTFFINGTTNNLDVSFSDGDTRFEGGNFIAQNVKVSQVSSNDILTNPIQSLKGSIHSTGNVISFNTPPIVEVDVQSKGELIFK
jgi:outer membrane protein assembly factor BamB